MMGYGRRRGWTAGLPLRLPAGHHLPDAGLGHRQFIKDKNGGNLAGKKIVYLYHDSAYGKEAIIAMEAEASLNKFQLVQIPGRPPGCRTGRPVAEDPPGKAGFRRFWGWGVMNQTALKAAQKVGFPRDKMIGSWWTGSEEDVVPAGDAAKGYMAATWNVAGGMCRSSPTSRKWCTAPARATCRTSPRSAPSCTTAVFPPPCCRSRPSARARRSTARGKGAERRTNPLGAGKPGYHRCPPEGDRRHQPAAADQDLLRQSRGFRQGEDPAVDGAKWVPVSDWIEGNKALIHPHVPGFAKQYAKERASRRAIAPRKRRQEKEEGVSARSSRRPMNRKR